MFVKRGDAQILDVVDTKKSDDDEKRNEILATALDKAKKKISTKATETRTEN